jgi:dihydrofolate reductase
MTKRRKIIVYIATSADGFIARPDGGIDWLERPQPKGNYGMGEFFKSVDTILWGRKTYDKVFEMGVKYSVYGAGMKHYVFSHHPEGLKRWGPGVEFVNEPIKAFARKVRAHPAVGRKPVKDIWMMGGGGIIGSFLDEGEIDEFSIHVIPILIGEGIPLVAPRHRSVPLKLLSTRKYPDGVVHLHYRVAEKQ